MEAASFWARREPIRRSKRPKDRAYSLTPGARQKKMATNPNLVIRDCGQMYLVNAI